MHVDTARFEDVLLLCTDGLTKHVTEAEIEAILRERQSAGIEVVGVASDLSQAIGALEELDPDLIIVDYDDKDLNRDEFLARFVEGESKLRVVLLSLHSPQEAIIYDRRALAASQIDNWLEEWNLFG